MTGNGTMVQPNASLSLSDLSLSLSFSLLALFLVFYRTYINTPNAASTTPRARQNN
jgi:hypothetical protein